MIKIVCEECRKTYDYEKDDFCPRCGAYNQPRRTAAAAVRQDGLNESGHAGSFAHREVHTEKAVRRAVGLDRPQKKSQDRPAARRPQTSPAQKKAPERRSGASVAAVVVWIIIVIQLLRLLFNFF